MSGVTFDAGALKGFERGDRRVVAIVARALERREKVIVPAGVVAQVWRDGRKQARLARLVGAPIGVVEPLDHRSARVAGRLCGVARAAGVVDASVVASACAHRHAVVTSERGSCADSIPRWRSSSCRQARRPLVFYEQSHSSPTLFVVKDAPCTIPVPY